ncbi:GGDEF domain-containing response regulator [Agarivorans sp.]|uniref:GGDEF domain-containing response regulator n=1 Tax=Agarivorans sp. TaxID=1872412 RepID=UPI003D028265
MHYDLEGRSKQASILLVDDELLNRELMSGCLSDDFTIYSAASGAEALQLAEQNPPDLILLDIMMPEMDGWEVCAKLKDSPSLRHIPVIFITSRNDDETQIQCWNAGCVDFINKPINFVTLEHRVKTHISLKLKTEFLISMSMRDGLTGIANRPALDKDYIWIAGYCQRKHSSMAVLMVDLDYFKKYNDAYGHLAGDDVLIAVARVLTQALQRASDKVYRYGGEEFVLLLADTDELGCQSVVNNINQLLSDLSITHASSPFRRVTCSIGGIVYPEGAITTELRRSLSLADEALYEAKAKGRNTSVIKQIKQLK